MTSFLFINISWTISRSYTKMILFNTIYTYNIFFNEPDTKRIETVSCSIYTNVSIWHFYKLYSVKRYRGEQLGLGLRPFQLNDIRSLTNITAVTAKLISAFVFATRIVHFLFFLNPKFQASSLLLFSFKKSHVSDGIRTRIAWVEIQCSNH